MGHDGYKTGSPGQILGNSCLRSRGQISAQLWWNLIRIFVLAISRPSSNMGNVGLTSRSPGQILENSFEHYRPHLLLDFYETLSECLSWQCLGQVRIWIMKGKQTRSNLRQLLFILVKLRPSNLDHVYNLVCGIELWHFMTLNLTFWPTFKALAFRFRPPRRRLLYIKWCKKELFCLRWAFQGPLFFCF